MSEANEIFSPGTGNGRNNISEDELLAYLEGKLSAAERHKIEGWLAEEGMESDAMDGLRKLDPTEARTSINKLNDKLHKTISNKKRVRRSLKTDQVTWMAIVIILFLIVLAYIVMRKLI